MPNCILLAINLPRIGYICTSSCKKIVAEQTYNWILPTFFLFVLLMVEIILKRHILVFNRTGRDGNIPSGTSRRTVSSCTAIPVKFLLLNIRFSSVARQRLTNQMCVMVEDPWSDTYITLRLHSQYYPKNIPVSALQHGSLQSSWKLKVIERKYLSDLVNTCLMVP